MIGDGVGIRLGLRLDDGVVGRFGDSGLGGLAGDPDSPGFGWSLMTHATAATGMRTRGLISASNSSRNSVSAECTGTYADGPRKQIVVILYGNGTASRSSRSLEACGIAPGQIDSPTDSSRSRSSGEP